MIRTAFSLTALLIAGAIFFLYTQSTYDTARSVKEQITTYDAALTKATELQELKQTLLSRYNTFDPSDIDKLHKLLPDHVDNVRLILDLDSLAGKHAVALQNVVVSTPQADKTAQTAVGAISSSKQKYDSLTMKFSTQATYDTFQEFIKDLEQSLRIVDLVSLKISSAGASVPILGAGLQPLYTFDITLKTYWLK